jgi:hypothetical protein
LLAAAVASGVLCGCGALDPERPVPQTDVPVYGNLLEVAPSPEGDGSQVVTIRFGAPRALSKAKEAEGRSAPAVEKGTMAEVTVTPDTVVLVGGSPSSLDAMQPGTEVVTLPVAGTTMMSGADRIFHESSMLMDFETYQRWQLPGLSSDGGQQTELVGQSPDRINSAGIEHSPVPLAGGRVLYLAARKRAPVGAESPWLGAERAGLGDGDDQFGAPERSFRTELGEDGWSQPEPVGLPGLEEALVATVTWVDEDETECLVTVQHAGEPPWVGRSTRAGRDASWGAVERIESLGQGPASEAVYLAGSRSKIAFVSSGVGPAGGDIFLLDPDQKDVPWPLVPVINTSGHEWAPRVGPSNELLFCRADRQLMLAGQVVVPLRVPAPQRVVITEANPTRDGAWVFFVSPGYTPGELDQDIYVASWDRDQGMGEAVPVDDWRP